MEPRAFALLALQFDCTVHGVDYVFGYRHAQTRAFGLVDARPVLAGERFENLLLELLAHTYAVVLHLDMSAYVIVATGRFFLMNGKLYRALFGSKFIRVRQQV